MQNNENYSFKESYESRIVQLKEMIARRNIK